MIDQWDALLTFALHHGIWELHSSNEISRRKVLLLVACSVSRDWGSFRYCHLTPWLESGLQGTMLSYKEFEGNNVKHGQMKVHVKSFHPWLGDIVNKFRHVQQCLISDSFYFGGNSWCLMYWSLDMGQHYCNGITFSTYSIDVIVNSVAIMLDHRCIASFIGRRLIAYFL